MWWSEQKENNQTPPDLPKKDVAATEMAEGLDDYSDECVQTTPPEATDVILSPDVEENGGKCDLQRAYQLSVEPLRGSSLDGGYGAEISKRNDSAFGASQDTTGSMDPSRIRTEPSGS